MFQLGSIVDVVADDAILLVFLTVGLGAGLGAVRIKGVALGPAAALFVGIAIGAFDESLSSAEGLGLLRELGLVLFTYTVGLASGPTFLSGLRRGGAKAVAVTAALTITLAGMCALVAELFGLTPADRAGLFAGSATNTPSLQAASEAVSTGDPVVAYSLAYPAAVISMLVVATLLLGRHLHLPAKLEPPREPARAERIVNWTVLVTTDTRPALDDLRSRYPGITFSRVEHDGVVRVATADQRVEPGDRLVVIGPEQPVAACCQHLGERSDHHLALDRSTLDFRRVLVSNRLLAGQRIGQLDLTSRFGVTATRLRRGDDDRVAGDDSVLELGDRVRVVGPADQLDAVARLFGDSERRIAEVDACGFALGIAAGLLVGTISVPLPGGHVELGAGGRPARRRPRPWRRVEDRTDHVADSPRRQPRAPSARNPHVPRLRRAGFRNDVRRRDRARATVSIWPSPASSSLERSPRSCPSPPSSCCDTTSSTRPACSPAWRPSRPPSPTPTNAPPATTA